MASDHQVAGSNPAGRAKARGHGLTTKGDHVTHSALLTRMRAGDIRSIPVGVWPLLGLALLDVFFRAQQLGPSFTGLQAISAAMAAAPFLFAAAAVYVSPVDRRFVYGALALAYVELLAVVGMLFAPARLNVAAWEDIDRFLGLAGWLMTLGGLLLVGLAIGGVRTRFGLASVALGAVLFLFAEVQVATLGLPALAAEFGMPIEQVLVSYLAPLVIIGWAYLLGAALDNQRRFLAVGAGIRVALSVVGVLFVIVNPAPGTDFAPVTLLMTLAGFVGWAALIAGALTESSARPQVIDAAE